MPKVKIDDREIEVAPGTNVIEAAKQAGIEIPHYCYHPHLSIAGNCRMCMVETETPRGPMLEIACNMQARDGLVVRTSTDKVKAVRKSVMEFLLVNHPLDCPICDQSGECRLQDYYMEHGQYDSRGAEEKVSKTKRQDIGDLIVLDAERCVQCSRCVRFGDEVTHTGDLRLMNRGDHTEIGLFPGERLRHNYQGNLADICPVGALTNKDFRFQRRVWYLKETASVCTGCATGCNIDVCHQEGEVFRYTPRRNDAVNKSWMCDPGRLTYKDVAGLKRLLRARVDGKNAEPADATAELARRIRAAGAERVGFVLGNTATNEANWALLTLVRQNLPAARVFYVDGHDPEARMPSDELLMDTEKAPNGQGVRMLARHDGKVHSRGALLEALPGLSLLVVLEDDVAGRLGVPLPATAYLGWRKNSTADAAAIVIPVAHAVEMDGSYVNRDGRVQRIRRAVGAMGDAVPAWQALEALGAALGKAPGTGMVALAFNAMARAVARLKGVEFKALGEGGVALPPEVDGGGDGPTLVAASEARA